MLLFPQRVLPHIEAEMNLIRIHYAFQRAAAHVAAPVMRATGFRLSIDSRDNRVINALIRRVSANQLADGLMPSRLRF
jgi:hypothetical protein